MSDKDLFEADQDMDGDSVEVRRVHGSYTFRVENLDRDFMEAFVSREDAVALAHWILQGEA